MSANLPVRQRSFVFEVTSECNHDCLHCYNAWKNGDYTPGQLGTEQTLSMLGRMLQETGASLVTLTGGEPMLRPDIYQIADFLHDRGKTINLISNGSLLTAAAVSRLRDMISIFELPLLSSQREIHDRLSGQDGAFDRVVMAAAEIKAAGGRVVCVFVATKLNLHTWRETVELAFALGADGIMFNRFNPGGTGGRNIDLLQASPRELGTALDIAQDFTQRHKIPISCSIAMPPCLFDHARWPKISFGYCAAGKGNAYYTLDPVGNVRPCNHSPRILGNILRENLSAIIASPQMRDFFDARPVFCKDCRMVETCLGGCKAAAEACCGSPWECDPFLAAFRQEAVRPV
jgi:radical SAM protein with 4Fe4S-binding SPASM domain